MARLAPGELFILNAGPPPDYNNEKLSRRAYTERCICSREREEMENAREREKNNKTRHLLAYILRVACCGATMNNEK
jgi:hypothetical protein